LYSTFHLPSFAVRLKLTPNSRLPRGVRSVPLPTVHHAAGFPVIALDNAYSETLFGSLQVERLHGQRFIIRRHPKGEALTWLLWYSPSRLHSTLNYLSPIQFEPCWLTEQIKQASS
jgi:transposase InsO family protein